MRTGSGRVFPGIWDLTKKHMGDSGGVNGIPEAEFAKIWARDGEYAGKISDKNRPQNASKVCLKNAWNVTCIS